MQMMSKLKTSFISVITRNRFRPKPIPMYLFFDTETSGLPTNWKAPVSDLSNWPRMIQVAWILCSGDGERLESASYIIRPEGFEIPAEASAVHGITTEIALNEGVKLNEVLLKFAELTQKA